MDKKKTHIILVIAAFIWAGVAFIAVQYIVGYPLLWILGKDNFNSPFWSTVYSALTYTIAAAAIILLPRVIQKHWKSTRDDLGLTELPTFTDIGISLLGFVATILISGVVTSVLSNCDWFNANQSQNIGYSTQIYGFDRAIAFISLAVIAPIAEEIIFRGWLYNKIKKHSSVVIATILVSILFGFLHGQWNVGITVGIMSIIMCAEREITGTIYAGILTHIIKNTIAFALLFLAS